MNRYLKSISSLPMLLGLALLLSHCSDDSEESIGAFVSNDTTASVTFTDTTGVAEIPAGAVPEADGEVQIIVTRLDGVPQPLPSGFQTAGRALRFEPEGQQFDEDVTLRLGYDPSIAASDLKVMRLDNASDTSWEEVMGASFDQGLAEVTVRSFSIYVVVSPSTSAGNADLSILLEVEDTIVDGVAAGDGDEDIADGWSVSFDRYLAAIGDVQLSGIPDASAQASDTQVFVVDLTQVSQAGLPLWSIDELASGDWNIEYRTPGASGNDVQAHSSVETADFTEMQDDDLTYLIEGSMSQSNGESCPPAGLIPNGIEVASNGNQNADGDDCYDNATISFRLGVPAATTFGPCEAEEDAEPGFNMPASGSQSVALTIHGDHIFFNGFPEGDEGGITRLAQWLADCDLNLDGEVTQAELEQIAPADLAELDDRYQFGGATITLNTMWDYVIAQLRTQGHFQGEGECTPN